MKVYNNKGALLFDTQLQTDWGGQDVILVVDQDTKELQEGILNELKNIKLCLSKMSDLEFKEE